MPALYDYMAGDLTLREKESNPAQVVHASATIWYHQRGKAGHACKRDKALLGPVSKRSNVYLKWTVAACAVGVVARPLESNQPNHPPRDAPTSAARSPSVASPLINTHACGLLSRIACLLRSDPASPETGAMKQPPRGRQEPRRMGNTAMVVTMLLSLSVLTYIRARYFSITFPKPAAELEVEIDEDYDSTRYKTNGPIGEEDFDPSRPTCYETSKRSERCAAVGDIRVDGNHSAIYISPLDKEWKTKPYARRHDPVAMEEVREYTLVPFGGANDTVVPPLCTKNHSLPAFLFSNGGFAGNLYHDHTDVLVPLFISTNHFRGEVQFLISGFKDWWVDKFTPVFRQLSKYDVIDVDNDEEVHCFPRIFIGATFHKAMGVDSSRAPGGVTVVDFKRLLRRAFRLERAVASRTGAPRRDKPRLLIISRKSSRRFLNERAMAHAAAAAKFDVRIAEPDNHTDMPNFARLVNSADVMMGVHGAGLTNMVFLPSRAVLIQVVPFGGLEWLARVTFKDPAKDMDVNYMEYNVSLEESSLRDLYPEDHFYLQHPYDVHKKGWDVIKTVYLNKQNVRLNLTRFTNTLEEARKYLP